MGKGKIADLVPPDTCPVVPATTIREPPEVTPEAPTHRFQRTVPFIPSAARNSLCTILGFDFPLARWASFLCCILAFVDGNAKSELFATELNASIHILPEDRYLIE